MGESNGDDGWATAPQDTRERTCEYTGSRPFSVLHSLRVARAPDPSTTTVVRTYEVTVEWTAAPDLPAWLGTVAETCTPYGGDRFGTGETAPVEDGRFRAAPVDATVRPPGGDGPALSDPYHYWNTPLARLQRDDHYPASVSRLAVDLAEGPDAVWTGEATASGTVERVPGDREEYARVGLEFTARERLQRSTDDATPWAPVAEPTGVDTALLGPTVEETLAEPLRRSTGGGTGGSRGDAERPGEDSAGDDRPAGRSAGGDPPDGDCPDPAEALAVVERQIEGVWSSFRWDGDGDPFDVPEAAVAAATTTPR